MSQRQLNAIARELRLRAPYPQCETRARRREQLSALDAVIDRLRLDLSAAERRFGFARVELRARVCVAAVLRPGLIAVKVQPRDGGAAQYAVCDVLLRPLYPASVTLRGLRRRFPEV